MTAFNDDLLFIHIPKTGGWWAKRYLLAHVPNVVTPETAGYPFPIGHIPLRDVEAFTGRPPESWRKILAVIRNPYEQQLSQYLFWLGRYQAGQRHQHDVYTWQATRRATERGRSPLEEWLSHPGCDFHVWYEEVVGSTVKTVARQHGYAEFGGYYTYWLEVDGVIPPNVEILRQEELSAALPEAVAEEAGGVFPPGEPQNVGPGRERPVRDYYTLKAQQLVERKFTWAFEGWYERWPLPRWTVGVV